MKRTVSETEYYQIKVDSSKNRMYITLKGAWKSPQGTPGYVQDIIKAARMLKAKFSLLANFSMLLPFSDSVWEKIHAPALKALIDNGLGKSSQILPRNEETTALLEEKAKVTGMHLMAFGDERIAERFLDS